MQNAECSRALPAALLLALFCAAADAKVLLFRAEGFPTVDAPAIAPAVLDDALRGIDVATLRSPADFAALQSGTSDVILFPYGSAFPIEAWDGIRAHLARGGGLVILGGAPFHQPVRRGKEGTWIRGTRQTSFAHDLLIGPAEAVEVDPKWVTALPSDGWKLPIAGSTRVWELTVRLATRPEFRDEGGSEGEREGIVHPLVHLRSADGLARACPLVEIDRLRGAFAGGRWIFAATDAPLDAPLIRAIVVRALEGAAELDARPGIASVEKGEVPSIRVSYLRPRPRDGEALPKRVTVAARDDAGRLVWTGTADLSGSGPTRSGVARIATARPLPPGLYHVEVTAEGLRTITAGFWVRDDALLRSGPRITASRDWLRRDGRVFPVIGTTYMASDVHRQFLFEPNPHVWEQDFAQMQSLGINFVRTGIWTGWSRAMEADGTPRLPFLRALDAYVASAAKHGIVVSFTFFAFLPPAFGGTNPYLDPRSLEGQTMLVAGVAKHFRDVGWIHYDLINEPSYAPPEGLWSTRPIGDDWERRAWGEWVRQRHGDDVAVLRERWGIPTGDPLELPRRSEPSYSAVRDDRNPARARDFLEFTNDVVAQWAAKLRAAIRDAGGDVLVTLGQDEGGTSTRPAQQLHAESVDYTAIHPWWQNDEVLTNGVLAKVPEKPSLFQETGLMRLEDAGGAPWRSPELAAKVFARKFVSAFAARSGGAVEWAWNVNPYMPIDNESVIGFVRPDGTAKPEIDVVRKLAWFFRSAAPWLDDYEPERVLIVIPHARLFTGRPAAMQGVSRIIRVLAERFAIVPAAVSDLRLTPERLRDARLVIVPSPEFLDVAAAETLAAAAKNGTKVVITGAITGDSYGGPIAAFDALRAARPVRYRELTQWGKEGIATFDGNLQESLLAGSGAEASDFTANVWHQPIPLEYAREEAPLIAFLTRVLAGAGLEIAASRDAVVANLLPAPKTVLAVVVNETDGDVVRHLTIGTRSPDIAVKGGGWALVLYDRTTGEVIARAE